MRPPPYPKKIEHSERLFFNYKLDPTTYSLFDSTMSTPIIYGSSNLVGKVISSLPPDSTIFYFEMHGSLGWKLKRAYKPTKETAKTEDKKDAINKVE